MLIDLVQTNDIINLGFEEILKEKINKINSSNQIQKIKESQHV